MNAQKRQDFVKIVKIYEQNMEKYVVKLVLKFQVWSTKFTCLLDKSIKHSNLWKFQSSLSTLKMVKMELKKKNENNNDVKTKNVSTDYQRFSPYA